VLDLVVFKKRGGKCDREERSCQSAADWPKPALAPDSQFQSLALHQAKLAEDAHAIGCRPLAGTRINCTKGLRISARIAADFVVSPPSALRESHPVAVTVHM
jgi:hypothetical protein